MNGDGQPNEVLTPEEQRKRALALNLPRLLGPLASLKPSPEEGMPQPLANLAREPRNMFGIQPEMTAMGRGEPPASSQPPTPTPTPVNHSGPASSQPIQPTPSPVNLPGPATPSPVAPIGAKQQLASQGVDISQAQAPSQPRDPLADLMRKGRPELHGWKKGLDIAGQILAPRIEAAIPGSPGNYQRQLQQAEGLSNAQQRQQLTSSEIDRNTAEAERARRTPETAEQKAEAAKDVIGAKTAATEEIIGKKADIAGEAAGKKAQTASDLEAQKQKNRKELQTMRGAIQRELKADKGAAGAGGTKVTPRIQAMADMSRATLPRIDSLMGETQAVQDMLGPALGRWNDFWTGKVGAPNPRFAHYMDEMAFLESAITLAHSQGRVSNLIFEQFKKVFNSGKQAPENMMEALKVAKEWLSGYAEMAPSGIPNTPSGGKGVTHKFENGKIVPVQPNQ